MSFNIGWWGKEGHTPSVNYIEIDRPISKNKNISVQLTKWDIYSLFKVELDLEFKGRDHAGCGLTIDLLWFYFSIQLYDSRHWNYDEGRWYLPGEEAATE